MSPEVVLNFSFMRVVKCVFGFVDEITSIFQDRIYVLLGGSYQDL